MKKLNGYRPTHKNKWLFIQHGILSVQELTLLEFYADIMDFDKTHDIFGTFKPDFEEISLIFNCKSQNTVRNWHNKLLGVGFVSKTNKKGWYTLSCFERYITTGKWGGKATYYEKLEKDQPIAIILQNFDIDLQNIEEKFQPIANQSQEKVETTGNSNSIALGSSMKDEYRYFPKRTVLIRQEVRPDEEYHKIHQENPEGLTPEDMKWVDENLKEKIVIENDEMEKNIVEVFFNGDWDEYKRHLIPG